METAIATANREHFERLVTELESLEQRLRQGGGPERIAREHSKGKLTARDIVGFYEYEATPIIVEVMAKQLREALEHSARHFGTTLDSVTK